MRLEPPESVRALQRARSHKAKAEPLVRVSLLDDKVHRADVRRHAWAVVRANKGAPGGEGVTLAAVEADGVDPVLARLAEELRTPADRPDPIRRVTIPKRRGGTRPLGIPTVRDRVGQAAAVLVLEPIFEADFQPCSYGFRPKKDAHRAVEAISRALAQGDPQVLDADLTASCDSIPHAPLLAAVARRVVDRHILRLLTQWLRAPVMVERADGKREIRGGTRTRRGTPQGEGISPLLANGSLHAFATAWRAGGLERRWQARLLRDAEDFGICCRSKARQVQMAVAEQLQALGLTLNSAKTRVRDARQTACTFLGFTVRVVRSWRTGRTFPLVRPAAPACQRLRDAVKAQTTRAHRACPTADVIMARTRVVRGWAGDFHFQHCTRDFSALRWFIEERVRTYLRRKHRQRTRAYQAVPYTVLYGRVGLYRLPMRAPWTPPTPAVW